MKGPSILYLNDGLTEFCPSLARQSVMGDVGTVPALQCLSPCPCLYLYHLIFSVEADSVYSIIESDYH